VSSARELLVPLELYALGRLALAAGADVKWLVKWFLAVAAVAALFTVFAWLLLPVSFWATTLDLVGFVRVVQGISNAHTVWDISLLAHFNSGASDWYPRAVGPFTQPVGTAHYFVLPLIMCMAFGFQALGQRNRRGIAAAIILTGVFAGAVITPISRGSWIAAGIAVLLLAFSYRRRAIIVVALVLGSTVLLAVPASRNSIVAVVTGNDASSGGHVQAIDTGIKTVINNPLGLGVGQSGQFGEMLASEDSNGAGVGENMYLELLVSVGPVGFLAFVAWMLGLLWQLAAVRHRAPPPTWFVVGTGAALLGYIVVAMLASPLMRFTTSASIWLLIGLCTGWIVAGPRLADGSRAADENTAGAVEPVASTD
jgi:O-antigen ligase